MSGRDVPDSAIIRLKTGSASGDLAAAEKSLEEMTSGLSEEDEGNLRKSLEYLEWIEERMRCLRVSIEQKLRPKG